MSTVKSENLHKRYGDIKALNGLTFSVGEGELHGILGPNGAGKTTTIDILSGVLQPDKGNISVLGVDPTKNPLEVKKKLGILPEKESPPSSHTPREYFLDFIAQVRDLDHDSTMKKVEQWADRLDFSNKLDTLNMNLSRGQQQKVMLVGAFITDPDILVIDEPLANLDPLIQAEVKQAITEFNDDGMTVLLSTHQIPVAESLCDTVTIIKKGKAIDTFNPETLETSLEQHFIETIENQ